MLCRKWIYVYSITITQAAADAACGNAGMRERACFFISEGIAERKKRLGALKGALFLSILPTHTAAPPPAPAHSLLIPGHAHHCASAPARLRPLRLIRSSSPAMHTIAPPPAPAHSLLIPGHTHHCASAPARLRYCRTSGFTDSQLANGDFSVNPPIFVPNTLLSNRRILKLQKMLPLSIYFL